MKMNTKETFITIDPPSGWKYGFPKTITQEEYKSITSLKQWCIDKGYPKVEAESYGDYFHVKVSNNLPFLKKSSREVALDWWNNLPNWGVPSKEYYIGLYYSDDTITGEKVEYIWNKEVNQI